MSDPTWNDQTVPRPTPDPTSVATPTYPPSPASPTVGPPAGPPDGPPDDTPPTGVRREPVDESPWVRSVYLFGACATGGVMIIAGLLVAIGSLVSVITPDAGLRDGWDRGLVGLTEVADNGLNAFDEFSRSSSQDQYDQLCDDAESDDSFCNDLQDQLDNDESTIPVEVTDSIGLIRDEVHRQIRISAIAKLVGGLAVAAAGLLLFRFHSKQVTVYARR